MNNRQVYHTSKTTIDLDVNTYLTIPPAAVFMKLALRELCRCLALHPSKPLLLTASDDGLIKLWNWEKVRLISLRSRP